MPIVGIDVIVGPLITLVIFDTRKKSLIFDLAAIALLQLSALTYGVYAMYSGRPVFGVFVENRIVIVAASAVDDESLAKAKHAEFRTLPVDGPKWVFADSPTDPKEREAIAFAAQVGMGVQNLPQYFAPYSERRSEIAEAERPLSLLSKLSPDEQRLLDETLIREGRRSEQARFVPVLTRQMMLTALIDGRDGRLIRILAIDPRRSLQPDQWD